MGLNQADTVCARIEKLAKSFNDMASSHSTVVEYCNCHTKIMGSSLDVSVCTRIEKLANSFNDMTSSSSTVVGH